METVNGLIQQSIERFGPEPALIIKPGFRTRIWRYRDVGRQVSVHRFELLLQLVQDQDRGWAAIKSSAAAILL